MSKHTPRPWTRKYQMPDEYTEPIERNCTFLVSGTCGVIALVIRSGCKTQTNPFIELNPEQFANAQLIVTAPDLLEALRESLEASRLAGIHQHPDGSNLPWYANGIAVLAKAEEVPCDHNEIVSTGDGPFAWKCNKCGHVYGKEG